MQADQRRKAERATRRVWFALGAAIAGSLLDRPAKRAEAATQEIPVGRHETPTAEITAEVDTAAAVAAERGRVSIRAGDDEESEKSEENSENSNEDEENSNLSQESEESSNVKADEPADESA